MIITPTGERATLEQSTPSPNKKNYLLNDLALQVELSTVCNSLCLGCVRTSWDFQQVKSVISKGQYLDQDLLFGIFDTQAGKRIKELEFCGNIDEPLAHPEFLLILERLLQIRPDLKVHIHTNGSIRDQSYHLQLSKTLSQFSHGSKLRYGIDGVGDTHSIYRQKTNFDKAFENMKAAISGGAVVIWQYLVFPWNQHQQDEAAQLAEQIGCQQIWFRPDRSDVTRLGLEGIEKRKLAPPPVEKNNFNLTDYSLDFPSESIVCKFRTPSKSMLFLSWEGKIWPCCFHANVFYQDDSTVQAFRKHVLSDCHPNFNSLHDYSFDQICSHPFYSKQLVSSWDDPKNARNWRCVQKCQSNRRRTSDNKIDHIDNAGVERVKWN